MIVCICRAVSDRTVRAAIAAGAATVKQVGQACGAGTCCGACRPQLYKLIADARAGAQDTLHGQVAAGPVASGRACAAREVCTSPLLAVPSPAL